MSNRHNARKAAVQALYQWDITKQAAHEIEPRFAEIHDQDNLDKRYLRNILQDLPKCSDELEADLQPFLDRDFATIDPVERAILRLGAYELKHLPKVPTRVVINEMIELAKVFGSDHSFKFINGILDKLAKKLRA